MTNPDDVAAVILAAGRSSRMGTPKPLLPLGSTSVIERVVGSFLRTGVGNIVVVTGHEPEKLAPVLRTLPVRTAHNDGYDAGMFSSIRTGVAALSPDVAAFFILPADHPLVGAKVPAKLIDVFGGSEDHAHSILHPTCCGRRGHPPLISGRYREALLQAGNDDSLYAFLARHSKDEAEVEVEDPAILMDMDTMEDYRRLCRFAAIFDGSGPGSDGMADPVSDGREDPALAFTASSAALPAAFSIEDAQYLLSLLEVPDRVVRHCRTVAEVCGTLSEALLPYVPNLDVNLARTAGLLHDIARACSTPHKHALVGQNILNNLGLLRMGSIVGVHMVLPQEQVDSPVLAEEQLVYLADKLVAEDKIVGLEDRTARTLRSLGGDSAPPEVLEGLRSRMHKAQRIAEKLEAILNRSLDEVLAGIPSEVL